MQDQRHLNEAWKKTQEEWNSKRAKVNVGATKKEKLEEGQVVSEKDKKWIQKAIKKPGALTKSHPEMAKNGFSKSELNKIIKDPKSPKDKKRAQLAKTLKGFKDSEKKDLDGDGDIDSDDYLKAKDKAIKKAKAAKEACSKKNGKKMKEEEGATTTGDMGVPNEVPDSRVGKKKKPQVRTRREESFGESYNSVLDRAFKRFVLGDSIVYQEEDDEDMGVEDDIEDVDDVEVDDMEMRGDDMSPPEGEMSDLPVDDLEGDIEGGMEIEPEMPEEPVAGIGIDPIQARLTAIEARLAALEAGGAEITDLGDELPDGMEDMAPEMEEPEEEPVDFDDEAGEEVVDVDDVSEIPGEEDEEDIEVED